MPLASKAADRLAAHSCFERQRHTACWIEVLRHGEAGKKRDPLEVIQGPGTGIHAATHTCPFCLVQFQGTLSSSHSLVELSVVHSVDGPHRPSRYWSTGLARWMMPCRVSTRRSRRIWLGLHSR